MNQGFNSLEVFNNNISYKFEKMVLVTQHLFFCLDGITSTNDLGILSPLGFNLVYIFIWVHYKSSLLGMLKDPRCPWLFLNSIILIPNPSLIKPLIGYRQSTIGLMKSLSSSEALLFKFFAAKIVPLMTSRITYMVSFPLSSYHH